MRMYDSPNIHVSVVDHMTGRPVEGAVVVNLDVDNTKAVTDARGAAELPARASWTVIFVNFDPAPSPNTVQVSAAGYASASQDVCYYAVKNDTAPCETISVGLWPIANQGKQATRSGAPSSRCR
jgi:hypothetical protein